ncbi:MAG: ADP-ribosylglycohydrolase family protein [Vulcanimicrobiaceae bacterium]
MSIELRALGALVGSAVGDALGAPFEFKQPNRYAVQFPEPAIGGAGEMIGGGSYNWEPGEFTDDTQMAIALAKSIVAAGGYSSSEAWKWLRAWCREANDVGITTRLALSRVNIEGAALEAHLQTYGRSAGNGALMRVTPIGIAFVHADVDTLMAAARAQAALTHEDPAAGWGAAIAAELVRRAILGHAPLAEIDAVLEFVPADVRERFAQTLRPDWKPSDAGSLGNGSVWICLAQAVWALRHSDSFEAAVVKAVNLGDDADTVACMTGALAGAVFGIQAIPSRWTTYVHGKIGSPNGMRFYDNAALQDLTRRLLGKRPLDLPELERPAGPTEVAPRLFAADLGAAATADPDWVIVSLCRTNGRFAKRPIRRELYLVDREGAENGDLSSVVADAVDSIDAFHAEGRTVLVHCHGGQSRTGFILKAWAMRKFAFTERQAHAWLRERWPNYQDCNDTFREFLASTWLDALNH